MLKLLKDMSIYIYILIMPFGRLTKAQFRSIRRSEQRGRRKKANVQNQIKNIKKQIKKEPRIAIQTKIVGTLNDTPVIVHLNVVTGGTDNGIAIAGNTCKLMNVRIKGWFKSVGAANVPSRLDVILDRDPIPGTLPLQTFMYQPDEGVSTPVYAMIHPKQKKRFKILASIIGNPVTAAEQITFFDRFIKLNLVLVSKDGAWTQAGQQKNAILIVHWTEAAASEPTYAYMTQTVVMDDN